MKCPKCGAEEEELYCEEIATVRYVMPVKNGCTVWKDRGEDLIEVEAKTLTCQKCKYEIEYSLGDGDKIIL